MERYILYSMELNVRRRDLCDGPDAGQPGLQPGGEGHGAAPAEDGPAQETGIGLGIVSVYNPYMNREEIYDEKTFMDAWEKTGDTKEKNNFNQHLIIEISETGE
jgi:hypothetical protein